MIAAAMPRRTRILHVVDTLDERSAGGERAALGLAVHLPKDRFDVWLCTTRRSGGEPIEELLASGARHVDLGRTSVLDARGHIALLRLIHRLRPDVLHGHMYGSNVWVSLFGSLAGVPVVVAQEQTWSYEGQPVRRFLDGRMIGRLADAFVAVSSADAERMRSVEGVPAEKIRMIPNAWARRAPGAGANLREELGIAADAPVAASVMLMRPQKRLDVMVEAFAHTLQLTPTAHLVMVGEGTEREAVEAHIARLGLDDRIHVLGYREDVGSVWRAADALLLSSDFEGTPLSVLEGMAAGVAVVSTDVGGMCDITDDSCAVLVPRRDPERLGAALAAVLREPERAQAMGAAARTMAARFTADAHAARFAELYAELLTALEH